MKNKGIRSSEDYIAEFEALSRQLIERTAKDCPAGMPALLLRIETERRWLEIILRLRDTLYDYADIIDEEPKRLKGEQ